MINTNLGKKKSYERISSYGRDGLYRSLREITEKRSEGKREEIDNSLREELGIET